MEAYDVVVIGGGNLGLWTAHRLARRGFGRIAVLERGWAGNGATSRSAGVVRQQGGSETAARLGKLARELYLELGEELGLDSGFTETGYYIVAETEEEKEGFLGLIEVRRAAGVENEWVGPEEGRKRFPGLDWDRFAEADWAALDGAYGALPGATSHPQRWFGLDEGSPPCLWASVEPPGLHVFGVVEPAAWAAWDEAF